MYFFIVNLAKSNAKLFTRHGKGDFKSMWADYSQYLEARKENEKQGIKKYLEPAIVYSFNELQPAVVGKFTDGFTLWAKTIDESKEATFSLIDEGGKFRRFDEIPELVELLPEIIAAAPISDAASARSLFAFSKPSEPNNAVACMASTALRSCGSKIVVGLISLTFLVWLNSLIIFLLKLKNSLSGVVLNLLKNLQN